MGIREGRAFSSDLLSPNESFRILLHFKEKMPGRSAAPPGHAGLAGVGLALLACKRREQGAHAAQNLRGEISEPGAQICLPSSR